MRRFSLILLFVFALAGAAFAADDVIKIGVFNCLTGQNAFGGQLELEDTQLAHKKIAWFPGFDQPGYPRRKMLQRTMDAFHRLYDDRQNVGGNQNGIKNSL